MTTGILIHELVQKALTEKITSTEQLRSVTDSIIKESVERLYDTGLSEEEARNNIYNYIPPLADFMNTYIADKPPTVAVIIILILIHGIKDFSRVSLSTFNTHDGGKFAR